jgi:hypothetical protein
MQVLFLAWLVLAGIKVCWVDLEAVDLEAVPSSPADTTEVEAAEGPFNPPPKP